MAARGQEEDDYEKPRKIPRTLKEKDSGKRLIVVIEKASIEAVKVSWNIGRLIVNLNRKYQSLVPRGCVICEWFKLICLFRMVKTSNC